MYNEDYGMPSKGKITLWIVGVLLFFTVLDFLGNYYGLFTYGFFAPRMENVRRKTFENTQSYVEGKIGDLSNYKFQYDTTKDIANKELIKGVVRQQFSSFDISKLNDQPVLQEWLESVRGH